MTNDTNKLILNSSQTFLFFFPKCCLSLSSALTFKLAAERGGDSALLFHQLPESLFEHGFMLLSKSPITQTGNQGAALFSRDEQREPRTASSFRNTQNCRII